MRFCFRYLLPILDLELTVFSTALRGSNSLLSNCRFCSLGFFGVLLFALFSEKGTGMLDLLAAESRVRRERGPRHSQASSE